MHDAAGGTVSLYDCKFEFTYILNFIKKFKYFFPQI